MSQGRSLESNLKKNLIEKLVGFLNACVYKYRYKNHILLIIISYKKMYKKIVLSKANNQDAR